MKKLLFILLLLTSYAYADNLIDQEKRDNSGNRPWLKTITETAGDGRTLHIPVVSFSGSLATTPAASASTTAATLTQTIKLVTTAGTPVALGTGLVESLEIHARKSVATANTGAIYVGFSATGGNNYRVLAVGESYPISAPAGKKIDLATIYIDAATSGDGVIITTSN